MSKAYYPEVPLLDRNREKCSHVKKFSVLSYYMFKVCKPVKIKSGYYIKIVKSQKSILNHTRQSQNDSEYFRVYKV